MNVPVLNNKLYDTLKWVAQILLPALGTLYFSVAQIWGLPYGTEVVGTLVVVDTFLGMLLKLSNDAYEESGKKYGGTIDVFETDSKKIFNVDFKDPESLDKKGEVLVKINPTPKKLPSARRKAAKAQAKDI